MTRGDKEQTGDAAAEKSAAPDARASLHGAVQMVLAVVVFLLVNILSCTSYMQRDFSGARIFTLSPVTEQVLGALTEETRIVVAFATDSPVRDQVWRLARTYADARPGIVRAEELDPLRHPDAARALARQFDHVFRGNAVLVIQGEHLQVVPESALEIRRDLPTGESEVVGFTGEEALTAAVLRAAEGKPRVVYLISGKGPWPTTIQGTGAEVLRLILPRTNAVLRELSLDDVEDGLPEDADAILIANPRYDFSGREIRLLREFWEQRKGGITVLINPEVPTPNLDAFLRFHGIRVDRRTPMRVEMTPTGPRKVMEVPIRFLGGGALTDRFINTDARLPGTSGFLEVDTGDDLRSRGLRPFAIAVSEGPYWAESRPNDPRPEFDPVEDVPGPLVMIAGVERSAIDDERLRLPAARMVVFANPHILDPQTLSQENVDFLLSALNWTMDRRDLIGIGPRQPVQYRLTLTELQRRQIHYVALVLLPLVALITAWLVHMRRRA